MVEMILNRIADPTLEPQQVTIPTELIMRESCRSLVPLTGGLANDSLAQISTP